MVGTPQIGARVVTDRPIRISIHALGGQGGGVLADWIVDLAEHSGWLAQATSVPGVAQRTGATVYYVELSPMSDLEPVMALMPTPGDVDIVIAAELMEAGRAIARGFVTADRTTLIASSHRVFAVPEKMAMGDGMFPSHRVLEAARTSPKRLVLADYAAIAEANGAVISASLFGALAAADALPFPATAFEAAIRRSGRGVAPSLAAFAAALATDDTAPAPVVANHLTATPGLPDLPETVRPVARLGRERLLDYQGGSYAADYLDRLCAVARADAQLGGEASGWRLTLVAARHLALWMAYEDAIRVADLKTRASRFDRVRREAQLGPHQLAEVTEFMHPRYEEVCDLFPAALGERMLASPRARRWTGSLFADGHFVNTTRLPGFLLLWCLARLRGYRPRTLRYRVEQQRIAGWLETAVNAARIDYDLGVEVLRLQRLVKGYGETHERGVRSFTIIVGLLPELLKKPDVAEIVRRLHEAALKDDEGLALAASIRRLAPASDRPSPENIEMARVAAPVLEHTGGSARPGGKELR